MFGWYCLAQDNAPIFPPIPSFGPILWWSLASGSYLLSCHPLLRSVMAFAPVPVLSATSSRFGPHIAYSLLTGPYSALPALSSLEALQKRLKNLRRLGTPSFTARSVRRSYLTPTLLLLTPSSPHHQPLCPSSSSPYSSSYPASSAPPFPSYTPPHTSHKTPLDPWSIRPWIV